MIRFKLFAVVLLLAGLTQLTFAQPPIPPPSNCVITFDAGSPSSTVAGRVDAKGRYNIAAGWQLDRIEATVYLHGNPPRAIGKEAQKNLIFPTGITKATFWETSFAGLPSGDNASVGARIFIFRNKDGKKETDDFTGKSQGTIPIK
jgi:hypothetical protein